jgi:copper transport protein
MGGLTVAGGVIELIGVARQFETSWVDALALDAGTAPMLRLLSGVLVLLGLFDHVRPVVGEGSDHEWSRRWAPDAASAFGVAGLAVGVFSFAFDGHTVTRGERVLHAAVNAVHVIAGGVWLGGLVGLAVIGAVRHRRRDERSLAELVVRFSADASLALIVVAAAGLAMSAMIIDAIGDYTGTIWGRRLLLKVAAVGVAAILGGYNRFVLVPKLRHDPDDPALERAARTTIVVEALLLVFVAVATVALVNATPNA